MRIVVTVFLLLWITPVQAQQVCAAKIPPLAKRLNVPPTDKPSMLVIDGCNGKHYDILEIINKLLDRMDKQAKR